MMDSEWKKRYQELVQFQNSNGHTNVPLHLDTGSEYQELGQWVSVQRILYRKQKKRKGEEEFPENNDHKYDDKEEETPGQLQKLTIEQISLLDALNFGSGDPIEQCNSLEKTLDENDGFTSSSQGLLMDIADAYTIRAVLRSHERKRAHNQLMHNSLKALFAERVRTTTQEDILSELSPPNKEADDQLDSDTDGIQN